MKASMRTPQRFEQRHGQSALEYALFVAVVVAALVGMGTYVQRAIQANLKVTEDQINAEAVSKGGVDEVDEGVDEGVDEVDEGVDEIPPA